MDRRRRRERDERGRLHVVLASRERFAEKSRDIRRRLLTERFARAAADVVEPAGGEVRLATLTVSGQTVEAWVPEERLADVEAGLDQRGISVEDATPRDARL